MNEIIPFRFENHPIRVIAGEDGEPWFVAADVAQPLGYRMASDMTRFLDDDETGTQIVRTPSGDQEMLVINEAGLYSVILKSRKPEAKRFKRWVTHEVLPSIRKTGSYSMRSPREKTAAKAVKDYPAYLRTARALGLDINAARISANNALYQDTGVNVMQLFGATHFEAEQQELFFTPTELGKRIGVSAREFNMLLAEAGLQAKQGEHWAPLPAAEGFFGYTTPGRSTATVRRFNRLNGPLTCLT